MNLIGLKEKRSFTVIGETLNVRASETETGEQYLEGYAALYEHESRQIAEYHNGKVVQFNEIIQRGAFDEVLKKANLNVVFTVDHDRSKTLARTTNKTLELWADEIGLKFRAKILQSQLGIDTLLAVRSGLYFECSFVFTVDEKNERWVKEGDQIKRVITAISNLFDCSVVLDAAYSDTAVQVSRNLTDLVEPPAPVAEVPAVTPVAEAPAIEIPFNKYQADLIQLDILLSGE